MTGIARLVDRPSSSTHNDINCVEVQTRLAFKTRHMFREDVYCQRQRRLTMALHGTCLFVKPERKVLEQ